MKTAAHICSMAASAIAVLTMAIANGFVIGPAVFYLGRKAMWLWTAAGQDYRLLIGLGALLGLYFSLKATSSLLRYLACRSRPEPSR